jgi:hypothetical protein
MNEIVSAARTAREKLSSALAALQSPEAGNLIDTVAQPVASAMSALHRIETTGGAAAPGAGPEALAGVRQALEALQLAGPDNPVVDAATASVAGSLGLVFQIARAAEAPAPAPEPAPATAAPAPEPVPAAAAYAPAAQPPPAAQPAPVPQLAALAYAQEPAWAAPEAAAAPAAAPSARPPRGADPLAQTFVAGADLAATSPETPAQRSAPVEVPSGVVPVEAALGAHSPTNFFKGLSGNDVINDGGIFVATYQIPDLGQLLWIRVSLPGGYEFLARAEVSWTRETGNIDSPPGFGAKFREISSEARQLVYRYVRNREPLFHDDL